MKTARDKFDTATVVAMGLAILGMLILAVAGAINGEFGLYQRLNQ